MLKFLQFLFIISVILLSCSLSVAQNLSVYGKVIDKDSRKPIKDVNIYLANTQIGTTTNKNGYFEITNLPQGTFTIVLSHVSYYFIKKEIKLNSRFHDLGVLEFSLKAYELETVLVSDDENNTWKDQFEFFKTNFIGEGNNSDSTFITNPYKIDFFEEDEKLFATSIEPIEITNKALGYKIKYFLDYFEASENYTKYSGNAVFIPLSSNSKSDSVRWKKNRSETYKGSFRHFLEILNSGYTRNSKFSDALLNSNGFFIYSVKELPWEALHPFPEVPISTKNLLSEGNIETERNLIFKDFLRIYFLPDYEENDYPINYNMKYLPNLQGSYLKLEQDSVMIDIHGRYYDKFGIHTFGFFGQERISDMLPYEYEYKSKKQ